MYLLYGFVGGNELTGPIPSELGSLTDLRELWLGKFATVSRSESDTIILFGPLSYKLSPLLLLQIVVR
jgi:hypothetical protein